MIRLVSEATQAVLTVLGVEVGLAFLFHWATKHEQAPLSLAVVNVGRGDASLGLCRDWLVVCSESVMDWMRHT